MRIRYVVIAAALAAAVPAAEGAWDDAPKAFRAKSGVSGASLRENLMRWLTAR